MKRSIPLCLLIISAFLGPDDASAQLLQLEDQVVDDQIEIGYGLAIGDVDGDGLDDILLADKNQFVWYRNPDWQKFVMVENLTERDNVCLAARDMDGDGKVEVAVGAQWNPGETTDESQSGSVHFLMRPDDPTELWQPIKLPHEPTVHRMHWIKTVSSNQLVVLPLHGRENKNGEGKGVVVYAYQMPENPREDWQMIIVDSSMHMTHNFDPVPGRSQDAILIGGKEGSRFFGFLNGSWNQVDNQRFMISDMGFGEVRQTSQFVAGIQPMHGNLLVVYPEGAPKQVLLDDMQQGHALACADLLGQGIEQIVVGWREANDAGEFGIKLIIADSGDWTSHQEQWIDKNGMACEDLKIADLNQDGKLDIIAAGRSTNNLKIYWNKSGE